MVEGGAAEINEEELIDALFFAHKEGQKLIAAIHEMRKVMGKPKLAYTPPAKDEVLYQKVFAAAEKHGLTKALGMKNKIERYGTLDAINDQFEHHHHR